MYPININIMRSFSSPPPSSLVLLLLVVALTANNNIGVGAFSPLSSRRRRHVFIQSASTFASRTTRMYAWKPSQPSYSPRPSFLDQQTGESESAYFNRLSATASDPIAFEKQVFETMVSSKQAKAEATATVAKTTSMTNDTEGSDEKKQRGYQRAEDWEVDQEKERKEMTWEEKVKYDGQQDGDKFQQNEILRKNML